MKRFALVVVALFVALGAVVIVRTLLVESLQPPEEDPVQIDVDASALAARFAQALTYPTISNQDRGNVDVAAFEGLHQHFAESYPLVHETLMLETVNDLSLLYTWTGRDPSKPPILLMGHQDVVPVIPGTEADWLHPPFGGVIENDVVWGRGALDDKSSVVAILESVELLLSEGHQPERTIYLAFGHDEEVGGPEGAGAIAELFEQRGIGPFGLVLDEGGAIADGIMPGYDGRAAIVGIAEKGFISLELRVEGDGGHSSTPPDVTNIGILAAAIERLQENQFPARLDGAAVEMFRYLAPELPFAARAVMSNLWLFRPVLVRLMLQEPASAAMVRTTTAPTIINGGVKDNVLPINATAVVNHRILPGDTRDSVMQRVNDVIDDSRVQVRDISTSHDPSAVSSPDSAEFLLLGKTLRQVIGNDVIVTPYLVMGGTDAKYYSGKSPAVFRFLPVVMGADGLTMVHGTNERVDVASMVLAVRYMTQFIRNTDELPAD
ncbi:MAG: M20/M25/M40 family metallo-hydrolase [Acidobacteria bacterium]|nr:M20/M25/M40 family metallo-hydrolase [Acidobacteriota bacterium]